MRQSDRVFTTLTISNVMSSDAGTYVCMATSVGKETKAEQIVTVVGEKFYHSSLVFLVLYVMVSVYLSLVLEFGASVSSLTILKSC